MQTIPIQSQITDAFKSVRLELKNRSEKDKQLPGCNAEPSIFILMFVIVSESEILFVNIGVTSLQYYIDVKGFVSEVCLEYV